MKFYVLDNDVSSSKNSIIAGREPGYKWESPDSQGNLSYYELPNQDINFSEIILKKTSFIADFIYPGGSYGGLGYLVSERIRDELSKHKLPMHKFHELPLYQCKNNMYKYFWLQILVKDYDYTMINFHDSTFLKTDFFNEKNEIAKFSSGEELKGAFENLDLLEEKILPNKIYLNTEYYKSGLDLFYLDKLYYPFVITEKLKIALENLNTTGVVYIETSILLKS